MRSAGGTGFSRWGSSLRPEPVPGGALGRPHPSGSPQLCLTWCPPDQGSHDLLSDLRGQSGLPEPGEGRGPQTGQRGPALVLCLGPHWGPGALGGLEVQREVGVNSLQDPLLPAPSLDPSPGSLGLLLAHPVSEPAGPVLGGGLCPPGSGTVQGGPGWGGLQTGVLQALQDVAAVGVFCSV